MPLRLEIKKMLASRSERVKSVDFHATEPWVLACLYTGRAFIWNYVTSTLVNSFEVSHLPVRCGKFIVRKQWVITAADDCNIRVHNYNTLEKVTAFEAHTDYIRCVEVHPTKPFVLSCCDDLQIRLWDWSADWKLMQTFEGHGHYVMMVRFNPKDSNVFASASLDRTIKVWNLDSDEPNYSLEGHTNGVNCVDYYPGADKPYLVSGADDHMIKVWDYQTKTCVHTLDGHTGNVSAVAFHPELPLLVSASEDGTVRLWQTATYRNESTLNYGWERAWGLSVLPSSHKVAVAFDEGTIVLQLGDEKPIVSMDRSGKLLWAENSDIHAAVLNRLKREDIVDGERLHPRARVLGSSDVLYPQYLQHNSNGRFVAVCGDGEWSIYTAQVLRNKTYGSALDFAWSSAGTGDFATRESTTRIKVYKSFEEAHAFKPPFSAEALYGGPLFGVRGSGFVVMYDWDSATVIRRIDVAATNVYWSDDGSMLAIATAEAFFVLRYDSELVAAALVGGGVPAEGVTGAFDLVSQVAEIVTTGVWVGDCFLYTSAAGRLNYYVGGETVTLAHLDRPQYLLGYLARENRVFLMDRARDITSYQLLTSVLNYQTAIVRQDWDTANEMLPYIPESELDSVARFLDSQGFKDEALRVSRDPEHRFELAVQLGKLGEAHAILRDIGVDDSTGTQQKWKQLGDLALGVSDIALAESCARNASDLAGLLLIYSSTGNRAGLRELATAAGDAARFNIAFLSLFLLGDVPAAIKLLQDSGRLPEAAFMARTYLPSAVSDILKLWRADLATVSSRAAEALADPADYPARFPDLAYARMAETLFLKRMGTDLPASAYLESKKELGIDLIAMMRSIEERGGLDALAAPPAASAAAAAAEEEEEEAVAPAADDAPAPAAEAEAEAVAEADDDDDDVDLEEFEDGLDVDVGDVDVGDVDLDEFDDDE